MLLCPPLYPHSTPLPEHAPSVPLLCAGPHATPKKRMNFTEVFAKVDRDGQGELQLQEFRRLITLLVPDEDESQLFGVITRSCAPLCASHVHTAHFGSAPQYAGQRALARRRRLLACRG